MKRTIVTLLAAMMCIALLAGCGGTATETPPEPSQAPETQTPQTQPPETPEPPQEDPVPTELDYARLLTEIPADADIDTIIKLENRNFKHIQAMKVIFEESSFLEYTKAVTKLKKDKTMEAAAAALEARNNLIQTESVEDRFWFIWDGTTMPHVDGESFTEEDIDTSQMFGAGFEPFAIKYLLDDPSTAKGNILAVSGGGMLVWSNGSEGIRRRRFLMIWAIITFSFKEESGRIPTRISTWTIKDLFAS
ncbi:MAG TPA: hypothetical protein GX717_01045 [Clostridiaceae bacterium]|nr:hypothetical protein [Clostridiaceae bacterium]